MDRFCIVISVFWTLPCEMVSRRHGVMLTPDQKLLIARKLDDIGIDIIEAGSPITSKGELEAIKTIANEGFNAEICAYARIRREDIELVAGCDVDSVHLVVPVSEIHITRKLKKDHETVLGEAIEMVGFAREHGLIVELSGEDAVPCRPRVSEDALPRQESTPVPRDSASVTPWAYSCLNEQRRSSQNYQILRDRSVFTVTTTLDLLQPIPLQPSEQAPVRLM
ncbi:2-isopropylmalate synthase [Candidatus Methanoperedenaceae archaeon GB37]|nr:2-isopropylmalate synthase [Candidatus Methanoperedenaceae archaeon GB37]